MKKLLWVSPWLAWFLMLWFWIPAQAADFTLKWDASPGATGYRIYQSVDMGATWTMIQEVGAVTEVALTGQPDTLTLYRAGAFNSMGEAIYGTRRAYSTRQVPHNLRCSRQG